MTCGSSAHPLISIPDCDMPAFDHGAPSPSHILRNPSVSARPRKAIQICFSCRALTCHGFLGGTGQILLTLLQRFVDAGIIAHPLFSVKSFLLFFLRHSYSTHSVRILYRFKKTASTHYSDSDAVGFFRVLYRTPGRYPSKMTTSASFSFFSSLLVQETLRAPIFSAIRTETGFSPMRYAINSGRAITFQRRLPREKAVSGPNPASRYHRVG